MNQTMTAGDLIKLLEGFSPQTLIAIAYPDPCNGTGEKVSIVRLENPTAFQGHGWWLVLSVGDAPEPSRELLSRFYNSCVWGEPQ